MKYAIKDNLMKTVLPCLLIILLISACNDREQFRSTSTSFKPVYPAPGVLISVKDNGDGIPQKVLDKIFQPFFTTKPTGQGTGLGLSLSYDIIKAHGGEIKVESKEAGETKFIIKLSII
jgi:signal transduction histidine kinase